MMKRIIRNKGMSYPLIAILLLVVMLIGVGIFEIIRLNIASAAIRDKYEDAIISVCVQNYDKMYQPIRESHAASYNYSNNRWLESNRASETQIRQYLNSAMDNGELMQFSIDDIDFVVTPAKVAPSNYDTAQKFAISGTMTVTIPYRFAWSQLMPITLTVDVSSQWRAKF